MTPEEWATWDLNKAENLQSQRDDAIARIQSADAAAQQALTDAKAAADALLAAAKAETETLRTTTDADRQAASVAAAAALTAAVEPLNVKIAEHAATIAVRDVTAIQLATEHQTAIATLTTEHQTAIATLNTDHQAATAARDATAATLAIEHQTAIATLNTNHQTAIASLTAEHQTATAALNTDHQAAIASLTTAAATAASTAAATIKTLNATITDLQTQVATLTEQIAGKAGQYQVTTSAMHEVAIRIAAGTTSPAAWVNAAVAKILDGIVSQNTPALLGLALQKYPALPDTTKEQVLAIFGAPYLSTATPEQQLAALSDFGLSRFARLPPENQAAIGAMLAASQLTEDPAAGKTLIEIIEMPAETTPIKDTP